MSREFKLGCQCESCMADCICRMSSVNSASIDPPERITNRNCPVHGSPVDPSDAYKAARDDAIDFPDTSVGDEF